MSVQLNRAVWLLCIAVIVAELAYCNPLIPRKRRHIKPPRPGNDDLTLEKLRHECSGQGWEKCSEITFELLSDTSTDSPNYLFKSCAAEARGETLPSPEPSPTPAPGEPPTHEIDIEVTRPTNATVNTTEEPQRCAENKTKNRRYYCYMLGTIDLLVEKVYYHDLNELKDCVATKQPSDSIEYKTPGQIVDGIAKWRTKMVNKHLNCCNETLSRSSHGTVPRTVSRPCPSQLRATQDWDKLLNSTARLMKTVEALDSLGRENRPRCLRGCVLREELDCANHYYSFWEGMTLLLPRLFG